MSLYYTKKKNLENFVRASTFGSWRNLPMRFRSESSFPQVVLEVLASLPKKTFVWFLQKQRKAPLWFSKRGIPQLSAVQRKLLCGRNFVGFFLQQGKSSSSKSCILPSRIRILSGLQRQPCTRRITSCRLRKISRVSRDLWLIFGTWLARGHALSCKNSIYPSLSLFPSSPSNRAAGILPSNEFA